MPNYCANLIEVKKANKTAEAHAEQMEGYENPFERDDDSDEIEEE